MMNLHVSDFTTFMDLWTPFVDAKALKAEDAELPAQLADASIAFHKKIAECLYG